MTKISPLNRILVIDDEPVILTNCAKILTQAGYTVETALNAKQGLEKLKGRVFDVLIVDLKLPDMNGIEVIKLAGQIRSEIITIMITGYSTVATAVEAMKIGAYDYIPKPFTKDELLIVVNKAVEKLELIRENRSLRQELKIYAVPPGGMVGKSPKIQEVYQIIDKVAPTESNVLIYGQSGTGKELVARAIHAKSARQHKQFVPVDCVTITESLLESELFGHIKGSFTGALASRPGLLETADEGTVFLDEIGNINPVIQGKLLRVIQEREFKPVGGTEMKKINIRLIAATNKNLEEMIVQGTFREDLFYRLNVVPIFVPPLKERKSDIPTLAYHFLKKCSLENKKQIEAISPEAMKFLVEYDWPGNVRELENVIERSVVMSDSNIIQPENLPFGILSRLSGIKIPAELLRTKNELKKAKQLLQKEVADKLEKHFLLAALSRNNWNISDCAKESHIDRANFHALMRKHGIKRPK